MKTGLTRSAYSLAFGMAANTAHADFPVQNLNDLVNIRRLFKAGAAGAASITFTLASPLQPDCFTLLHHNASLTDTVRYRLFAAGAPDPVGNAANLVEDSGVMPLFPSGAGRGDLYNLNRPWIREKRTPVASGLIDLSAHATGWAIGGFEAAVFWDWSDHDVGRSFGVRNGDDVQDMAFNTRSAVGFWSPRVAQMQRNNVEMAIEEDIAMDFQRERSLSQPFVYLGDYDDPATWDREIVLVTQERPMTIRRGVWPTGQLGVNLVEHLL